MDKRFENMSHTLLQWFEREQRTMPWRESRDPYAIWISEIMLQQTRVDTVTPYYLRFMAQFPTVAELAAADEQTVLKAWEGLGYYSRARNLRRAAQLVLTQYGGCVPDDPALLQKLPGVGEYTAGAIASIAFGKEVPAVDGNVLRVLSRWFACFDDVMLPAVRREFTVLAKSLIPEGRAGDFNQALMEIGALVCVPGNPRCGVCPMTGHCLAYRQGVAEQLPVKTPKSAVKDMHRLVFPLMADGCVLIRQREERLLNGMWEFPTLDGCTDPELLAAWCADRGLEVQRWELGEQSEHLFTHLRWKMQGVYATVKQKNPVEGFFWADQEALLERPFPSAMRVYVKGVIKRLGSSNDSVTNGGT